MSKAPTPDWERKSRYAQRWDCTTRTIDRWREDGVLGEEDFAEINGLVYVRVAAVPKRGKPKKFPPLQPHQQ
jgi:hypothetical protein